MSGKWQRARILIGNERFIIVIFSETRRKELGTSELEEGDQMRQLPGGTPHSEANILACHWWLSLGYWLYASPSLSRLEDTSHKTICRRKDRHVPFTMATQEHQIACGLVNTSCSRPSMGLLHGLWMVDQAFFVEC